MVIGNTSKVVAEYADHYQRLEVREYNDGQVMTTVTYEDDNGRVSVLSVNIPTDAFKELVNQLEGEYGEA